MLVKLKLGIELLKNGKLVAFPTETVYGLGADATNEAACRRVYEVKGRPSHNPLIVHINTMDQAKSYGRINEKVERVIERLWPGPLTIIVQKRNSDLCDAISSGLETIALRAPHHTIAQSLIDNVGPIAAPSANKSGYISATDSSHVIKNFAGSIPVIEGGKTFYGLESTIIDFSTDTPELLRPGFIDLKMLSDIMGENVNCGKEHKQIKAPGMLQKHYAPACNLRMDAITASPDEVVINFGDSNLISNKSFNLSVDGDLVEAAANLYSTLLQAEGVIREHQLLGMAIVPIPNHGVGFAINDKLRRASAK